MKIETVPSSKFDARVNKLIKQGYSIVSQGDLGVVFQKKKTSLSNIMILFGLVACITIIGLPVGIPLVVVGLIAKFCSGTNYNQITLRKA
jgi:uncharacterized membrane protein YccF (DUF307 family)